MTNIEIKKRDDITRLTKIKCCSNCKYNLNGIELNGRNVSRCDECLENNRIHWELAE